MNQNSPAQQQQQQQQLPNIPQQQQMNNQMPPVTATPAVNSLVQNCIRNGCTNPAIVSADWEDEYCSNECVTSHCRDVFANWVHSQTTAQQQQNFSAVK